MPCQLSRMWRLKGRWVVGGEVYANCKQVPFCSSKLYKSVHSVVCIFYVCVTCRHSTFQNVSKHRQFWASHLEQDSMGFPSGVELHVEVAADSEGRNASPPPHAIPSPSIALQLLA